MHEWILTFDICSFLGFNFHTFCRLERIKKKETRELTRKILDHLEVNSITNILKTWYTDKKFESLLFRNSPIGGGK
jgi:hypothetical protein